jgi:hypothetical protein
MAKLMSIAWQLWEIDKEPSAQPVTAHFDLDVELNVWAAPKTSHLEAEEKSNPS